MCHALAKHLAARTQAKIEISTAEPSCFTNLLSDRISVTTRSPLAILKALLHTDYLIQGGGTIFHDSYRFSRLWSYWISLSAWVFLFACARLMGAKVMVLGSGIGPARFLPTRLLIWAILKLSSIISVRDAPSAETARAIVKRNIKQGFDLAALEPLPARQAKSQDTYRIGLSICDLDPFLESADSGPYWSSLATGISEIAKSRPLEVTFLSLFSSGERNDDAISREMAKSFHNLSATKFEKYTGSLEDITIPLANCDLVIATKFHAAVAAYLACRQLVVIAYNRKVSDFAVEIGLKQSRVLGIDRIPSVEEWVQFLSAAISEEFQPRLSTGEAVERSIDGVAEAIDLINCIEERVVRA
jgi:polysaccharide pyruvyl transferase WcaK-like protein